MTCLIGNNRLRWCRARTLRASAPRLERPLGSGEPDVLRRALSLNGPRRGSWPPPSRSHHSRRHSTLALTLLPPGTPPPADPGPASPAAEPLSMDALAVIAAGLARTAPSASMAWRRNGERRFARLLWTPRYEAWLIAWSPSSGLDLHDHGGSVGSVHVAEGALVETYTDLVGRSPIRTRGLVAGEGFAVPTNAHPRGVQRRTGRGAERPRLLPTAREDDLLRPPAGTLPRRAPHRLGLRRHTSLRAAPAAIAPQARRLFSRVSASSRTAGRLQKAHRTSERPASGWS